MKRLKGILVIGGIAALMGVILTGCFSTLNYTYKNADKYTAGDRKISEKIDTIDINYLSGNVNFSSDSSDGITVTETANKEISEDMKVHTWVNEGTLYVRYCASSKGLDFNNIDKNLDIAVPENVELDNLKVDISSGSFTGKGFYARSVDASASSGKIDVDCESKKIELSVSSGSIDVKQHGESDSISMETSSGKLKAEVEKVNKVSMDLTSGNATFKGMDVKNFEYGVTSGDGNLTFYKVPESSKINGTSADIKIYIPENSDLTVALDQTSGDFDYEIPFEKKNDKYILGSGTNKMVLDTTSGDIKIKKTK